MTPKLFRKFLFFKLPIAYIAGLRLAYFSAEKAQISIRYSRWNMNPFHSMFWAVQGMGAELSTGIICISEIQKTKKKVSMLVIEQKATFTKKAMGKIVFTCTQGAEIAKAIEEAVASDEGKTLWVNSTAVNETGDTVAHFSFLWTFKLKA